jgi:uncharacterized membrane protein
MDERARRVTGALLLASAAGALLFFVRAVSYHSLDYWYLNWNLFLAWLPLIFAWILVQYARKHSLGSWQGIGLGLLWLGFLPNSFYLASDLIHLQYTNPPNILFDAVLILLFTFTGFLLGFMSIYLVHSLLIRRLKGSTPHWFIAGILLLSSYAIYLGRFLRWNTWDVVTNPAGLIFDVSDPLINPSAHHEAFSTTILFFIFIGTLYVVIWQLIKAFQAPAGKKQVSKRSAS